MTPEQLSEYRDNAETHAATLEANQNASQFIGQLTRAIFAQLSYDFLVNRPANICTAEEVRTGAHAIQAGTVHAIGGLIEWDIYAAREFAACILEDVNDHGTAAMLRKLTEDETKEEAAQ